MSEVAIITTTEGEMVLEFWPDVAPGPRREFQEARQTGILRRHLFSPRHQRFHDPGRRSADEGRCQGSIVGAPAVPATRSRPSSTTRPTRAASSPWRARNDPDSAGSQFFICHGDPRFLDRQYTAFGKLIKGDDVLEKIATTPTHPGDRPVKKHGRHQRQDRPGDSVK